MTKTIKKGGELLGQGAYGCVFNIEFPCRKMTKGKRRRGRKYVSKVFFHKHAIREAKDEFKINAVIKKIKNYRQWCVIWDKICRPHSYKEIYKTDKKIKECLKKSGLSTKDFNQRSAMLVGEYGGATLDSIISHKLSKISNETEFLSFFKRTMKRMLPLFKGIYEIHRAGLSHSDIKRANIVLDNRSFKLIDFGLACKLSDTTELKKRTMRQYYDDRIYTPYPIDFVYAFTSDKQENVDRSAYMKGEFKNNFREYRDVHTIFFKRRHIVKSITNFLKDTKVSRKKLFETIDVYSLGYLIPKCIFSDVYRSMLSIKDVESYLNNSEIKPFIALFKDMTRETFFNEGPRISTEEAYARFNLLVKNIDF
jgi:serine/threonine protein kinase